MLRRLRERLKTCLPEGRYRHSLGVEMAATMLARRHGADEFACACAGLLHDVARDLDAESLRRLAEEVEGEEVEAADAVLL
ncbi:MAG: HD domain-containing protein, partial [Bacillota bacterium]